MQFSTTLRDVNNINDLVNKLDEIYIPDQMMLAIDDPLLQKYVALGPDGDRERARLERQMGLFFDEQLAKIDKGQKTSSELSEMLGRLYSYTRNSKVNRILHLGGI